MHNTNKGCLFLLGSPLPNSCICIKMANKWWTFCSESTVYHTVYSHLPFPLHADEFRFLCPNGEGLYYDEGLIYSLPAYHGRYYKTWVTIFTLLITLSNIIRVFFLPCLQISTSALCLVRKSARRVAVRTRSRATSATVSRASTTTATSLSASVSASHDRISKLSVKMRQKLYDCCSFWLCVLPQMWTNATTRLCALTVTAWTPKGPSTATVSDPGHQTLTSRSVWSQQ